MYDNLNAEMVRHGVTKAELARFLKLRYATVLDKLNGKSRFYFDEAYKIKQKFFPHLSIEYLFYVDEQQEEEEDAADEQIN
ncbi:XRE family transcriptional regulator [Ornithinibacillus sp. JPR2-1]|uniref:XRE family transcriptional regulator n=1 Tax=Ornithinibacillus sp. JPR2-1 TaxID=2094019 RepID=UPI0031DF4E67